MNSEPTRNAANSRGRFLPAAGLAAAIGATGIWGARYFLDGSLSPSFVLLGLILPILMTLPFRFLRGSAPDDARTGEKRPRHRVEDLDFPRHVFDALPDGILVYDPETKPVAANRRARELFGTPENPGTAIDGESVGFRVAGFGGREDLDLPADLPPDGASVWEGRPDRRAIHHVRSDGAKIRLESTAFPMRNDAGEPIGIVQHLADISDRRRDEEERRRLTTALEQVAESIVVTDAEGRIEYVNAAFERVTGHARKAVLGSSPRILKSGLHDDAFYAAMWRTLRRGEVWTGHLVNRKKNGDLYEEEASISPVRDEDGAIVHFVAVKRDVTEEIKMERRLRQAQKMESIGTLAGGIAHDFNNILFPIIGYTEIVLEDLAEGSTARANLREVLAAAGRARELVQQILTFSRSDEQERKPLKMQIVVKEALKLIQSTLPATIEIVPNIDPDCKPVLADPTRIHQIVMNLCTNAYHAMMETGGRLEVSLRSVPVDPEELDQNFGLRAGPALELTIRDTGLGMDRFTQSRIFDPYFTTKEPGKGTGMGLSVVHGIVKGCGGGIRVESESGAGTAFRIYFPPIEMEPEPASEPAPEAVTGGAEHILLVDDEVQIVEMERQMLERLGYTVTVRTSGVEALEVFRAAPDRFDLVVTDQTMPNLTGAALTRRLRSIRPDIPVILCTGFSEALTEEEARFLGVRAYLMKPVVKRQMARAIRRALSPSGDPGPSGQPPSEDTAS